MILQVLKEEKKLQSTITEINKLERIFEKIQRLKLLLQISFERMKKLSEQSLRKRERKFQVGNHWGRGGSKRNAMQMPHNLFLQKRKGAIRG